MSLKMDATVSMYGVKKVFDLPEKISLPTTMYPMKNIHASSQIIVERIDSSDGNEFKNLEIRQEKILAQLEELGHKLQQIRNNSKSTNNAPKVKLTSQEGMMRDVVIKANPDHPPLALPTFYKWLKNHVKIGTETFVHSSVSSPIDNSLKELFSTDFPISRSQSELFITLIWHNTSDVDPAMIINPMSQVAIKGEVNILRYLSSFVENDESDVLRSTDIDTVLDLVHGSLVHGNNKERQSVLRTLNSRLGKNKWINGDSFSVADIATWAALKQNALLTEAPANVKKWAVSVEKLS